MFPVSTSNALAPSVTDALRRFKQERVTSVSGTGQTITLGNRIVVDTTTHLPFLLLFQNGTLLDPTSAYTVSGKTVTLTGSATGTDWFLAFYWFTPT